MARSMSWIKWLLYGGYAVAGAVALLMATPAGLKLLGQSIDQLTFLPARLLALLWSLALLVHDDGAATALAILGVGYILNLGIGLVLVRAE
ncbi:hypothetical protein GCM10009116_02530 [Brevundimonas basaltis]|uniref:Uncharacterized protein n=1 Tax=Brevundimonas basaltis TaxID=472166 RepID=A0A7W8HZ07_9CAUL|nr:hypothetical protein [Brevundimonas basaltis]MBB5292526.1 hypothetical protein [Brevundimonas basaltis]